jgi:hypothetical protein
MKTTTFIVFADTKTKCGDEVENIFHPLQLNYLVNNTECAIGLTSEEGVKTKKFSDFQILLFDDKGKDYTKNDFFIESFATDIFNKRNEIDFKVIFHDGSKWNFGSFFPDKKIHGDFTKFENELAWLITIPSITQQHNIGSVYSDELMEIANAIKSKSKDSYNKAIDKLNRRFIDPIEEGYTEAIFQSIYKNESEALIEVAVTVRDKYLLEKVKQTK